LRSLLDGQRSGSASPGYSWFVGICRGERTLADRINRRKPTTKPHDSGLRVHFRALFVFLQWWKVEFEVRVADLFQNRTTLSQFGTVDAAGLKRADNL
jgi:hypothetical protein